MSVCVSCPTREGEDGGGEGRKGRREGGRGEEREEGGEEREEGGRRGRKGEGEGGRGKAGRCEEKRRGGEAKGEEKGGVKEVVMKDRKWKRKEKGGREGKVGCSYEYKQQF